MLSSSELNPPAVPWPPAMGMLPAAMPTRGSTPSSLVMPRGMRFCNAMTTTRSSSIMTRVRPPCLMAFMFDWKPTEVKNASMKMSLSVPSNDISASHAI